MSETFPRALTLDLDDTLWPVAPVIERAEQRLHEWMLSNAPETARRFPIEAMRRWRAEVGRLEPSLAHDLTALRRLTIERALTQCGEDPALADAAFELFIAQRHEVELYEDVLPALERLARRFPLLALSNGNADIGRIAGLGSLFVGRIGAREAGFGKPDARIFQAACSALQLAADEVLHIGDDWLLDVCGARDAGLHSAWVHRGMARPPGAAAAPASGLHLEVHDLTALADALGA
jgi:putative hydrolase of the HAD superfamily